MHRHHFSAGRSDTEGIDRRAALKLAALGAAGLLAPGCVRPRRSTEFRQPLVPVQVSQGRIIRRVVGLRPYRPAGFLVGTERLGDKLIVHDYGHGGGGISLSSGTAQLAVELAAADVRAGPRRAAVVGQWAPSSVFDPDTVTPAFLDQFTKASQLAYREFQNLVGTEYSVRWLDHYFLENDPPEPPGPMALSSLLPNVFSSFTALEPHEHPFAAPYCSRVTLMLVEPATYLNALLRDARIAGATVVVHEFADRQEVAALAEPVIMNCTGLGARGLFGDEALIPAKGQLTVLQPQPEVNYAALGNGVAMFSRTDGILLAGTFEPGDWSLEVDLDAEQRILDGNRRLFEGIRR